jgi:RNA recognition motif-containing protein
MLGITTELKRKDAMPRLFIGNVPHASSDVELRQWVESRGIMVKAVEIIHDRATGKPRGFGFVTVDDDTDTRTAIGLLNGKRMRGRILTVSEATPLSKPGPFATNGSTAPLQNHS